MAYYKKVKQKGDGKWHPRAVTLAEPATTDDVAERLTRMSSVTAGDVYAVLANLGPVLAELMNEGRSVRLKGVGTFFLTCSSQGAGVDSPEEVTSRQITAAKVRFIPEYSRKQVTRRRLSVRTSSGRTSTTSAVDAGLRVACKRERHKACGVTTPGFVPLSICAAINRGRISDSASRGRGFAAPLARECGRGSRCCSRRRVCRRGGRGWCARR